MAVELILTRTANGFIASDAVSQEALQRLRFGHHYKATLTQPRRLKHHRLAFALLQAVYESQTVYTTFEHMLDGVKIALGHYDVLMVDGREVVKTRSVAFANMDQVEFGQWYERMLEFILARVVPNTSKVDLERRIFDILGEYHPDQSGTGDQKQG